MRFPFERQAALGEPLPAGMRQSDNKAYLALRSLYRSYNSKAINREEAKRAKEIIFKEWKYDKFTDAISDYQIEFIKATERLTNDFCCNPTMDTAKALIAVINGLERPWVPSGRHSAETLGRGE